MTQHTSTPQPEPQRVCTVPMSTPWDGFTSDDDKVINTNHSVFQLGRQLYEAQVLLSKLERGDSIHQEDIRTVLHWFCQLVNATGQLRAYYNIELEGRRGLLGKLRALIK